ncbi:MAG: hypothetical protein QGG33_04345 [Candidatus Krumholzibacteria bacterium]|nr:hypothetical protein [Candidatus Krumholzibacteria bacterium]
MKSTIGHGKVFLGLLFLLSCAENPGQPSLDNHAPEIISMEILGDKPVVAAGETVTLQVMTTDLDGDPLLFVWSGEGLSPDTLSASTIAWTVPASYGTQTVSCSVTDGDKSDSYSKSWEVGLKLSPSSYGEIQGSELLWINEDSGGPPFYVLTGQIELPEGVSLRIEENCSFWCDPSSRVTVYSDLDIEGTGVTDRPVHFQPRTMSTSSETWWKGLRVGEYQNQEVRIRGLVIENAEHAVLDETWGNLALLSIQSSKFVNCNQGVKASDTRIEILGLSLDSTRKGIEADACNLSLETCGFTNCYSYGIALRNSSSGYCLNSVFSDATALGIRLSGNSYLVTQGCNFTTSVETFLEIGEGFEEGAPQIDARCNYWGGLTSTEIAARIVNSGAVAVGVQFLPLLEPPPSQTCELEAEVTFQSLETYSENHPLEGHEDYEDYDFSLPHSGFPATALRLSLSNPEEAMLFLEWSSPDDVYFCREEGPIIDWASGYMDETFAYYPGQSDGIDGSSIYFVTYETEEVTLRVDWTWVAGGNVLETGYADSTFTLP